MYNTLLYDMMLNTSSLTLYNIELLSNRLNYEKTSWIGGFGTASQDQGTYVYEKL